MTTLEGSHGHAVQFYDTEVYLHEVVAEFLAGGLDAGQPALVIATPQHRDGFASRLRERGVDVDAAQRDGRLVLRDAAETLRLFCAEAAPDEARFFEVVGELLRETQSARVYGEMVDLLWRDGRAAAAVRLEELWNELGKRQRFALLCAYPMSNFGGEEHTAHFASICAAHTLVHPSESVSTLGGDEQLRRIALMQQRAESLEAEVAQRRALEEALRRTEEENRFLLAATTILNQSLDYQTRLRELAALALPRLADWCAVDIVRDGGGYERVAVAHVDPQCARVAAELQGVYPDRDSDPVIHVLREAVLHRVDQASPADAAAYAHDSQQYAAFRTLGAGSLLTVPMTVGTRSLGAITFGSRKPRDLGNDVALAIELARRAAIALENARLYHYAEQANRAKDEFLATLSHELRTPLTAILGWANMLRAGDVEPSMMATALDTIDRSARAQAALIDDILDLSAVITGKFVLQQELIDLTPLVVNAIETVRLAAAAKRLRLDLTRPAEPLLVSGDATRLQQIAWNLLSNAIKFSEPGGAVAIDLVADGGKARLTVRDAGIGIDAAFLPHVFEPFRQAEPASTRRHGGLGLGLAIVKHFTEMHGGSIDAASGGTGRGATFTVTLPLAVQPEEAKESLVPRRGRADLRGAMVLVVEDDAETRALIAAVLRTCGADVKTAASVSEACQLLGAVRPDVIVSEVAMPERDGFSLVHYLRTSGGALREVPVVALAPLRREGDEERILAAGFHACAAKPLEPVPLTHTVAAMYRRAAAARPN